MDFYHYAFDQPGFPGRGDLPAREFPYDRIYAARPEALAGASLRTRRVFNRYLASRFAYHMDADDPTVNEPAYRANEALREALVGEPRTEARDRVRCWLLVEWIFDHAGGVPVARQPRTPGGLAHRAAVESALEPCDPRSLVAWDEANLVARAAAAEIAVIPERWRVQVTQLPRRVRRPDPLCDAASALLRNEPIRELGWDAGLSRELGRLVAEDEREGTLDADGRAAIHDLACDARWGFGGPLPDEVLAAAPRSRAAAFVLAMGLTRVHGQIDFRSDDSDSRAYAFARRRLVDAPLARACLEHVAAFQGYVPRNRAADAAHAFCDVCACPARPWARPHCADTYLAPAPPEPAAPD